MLRTVLRRTAIVLILGTLLTAASPAHATPHQKATPAGAEAPRAAASGLLATLIGALDWLWLPEGCLIDPHGGCTASTADTPPASDHQAIGCHLDPHGCTQ